jgi:hypothetical protein
MRVEKYPCNECHERKGKVVVLREGLGQIMLCATCLRKALKLIEEESDEVVRGD